MKETGFLFEELEKAKWDGYWQGMPEYSHDTESKQTIMVHFISDEDRLAFSELVGQKITSLTKSIQYPKIETQSFKNRYYTTKQKVDLKYPIYIPSKGRWESRLTIKALDKIGVAYRVVVEPQQYDNYAAVIAPENIIVLPFSNQGLHITRTWILEHSLQEGHERHWQLDDNISVFYRFNYNCRFPVRTGAIFRVIEDFVDRYENIDLAGMNYRMFVFRENNKPPITWNTRIYSCTLVNNNQPERWLAYFNDDTDISLRVLLKGRCTTLFNAFLCDKMRTMTVKGGLTDDYQGDGRLRMAESLQKQHPHLVKVITRWGRPQHYVDYSVFKKNKPILKPEFNDISGIDNYGMFLEDDFIEGSD